MCLFHLHIVSFAVHTPLTTTTQSTTVEWTSIATETAPWKQRPARTNSPSNKLFSQTSNMVTTEAYRSVTLYQHTSSDEADVFTSSKKPAQDVIYKNLSFHRGQSSSSPKLAKFDLVRLLLIPSIITSFTEVIWFFSCNR
jgi:hypothetical protein